MREIFRFEPGGAVPSPDATLEIVLEDRHHAASFAVLLADSIGYFDPLLARLRDPDVKLESYERQFLADNWGKRRAGGNRRVKKHRKWLRIAAHYLEFDLGEPSKGQKVAAEKYAAAKCDIDDTSEVRRAVRFAKTVTYKQWPWFRIASRLARKGKLEQLHQTY